MVAAALRSALPLRCRRRDDEGVTALDAVIVAVAALAALGGLRRGFVVGALGLAGLAVGLLLGTTLGGRLAETEVSALPASLAFAGGFIGSALGAAIGARLRVLWVPRAPGRRTGAATRDKRGFAFVDRLLGALLSAAVVLGVAWLAAAVARQSAAPLAVRAAVQESLVLTRLAAALPSADPILAALPRLDSIPRLRGPSADVAPAPRGIVADPQVRAARESVVRVVGSACGGVSSGSGWVAERGVVITNAAVVAGQDETRVRTLDTVRAATVVSLDRRNDIAVLRVPGLAAPALPMASDAPSGTPVAMLGFPGGDFRASRARLGATRTVLFGAGAGGLRSVTVFRAAVNRGNSGGPLVDRAGHVAATVFAARVERRSRTGFAVPNDPVREALESTGGEAVDTGGCRQAEPPGSVEPVLPGR